MGFDEYVQNQVAKMRKDTFDKSEQLSLGEVIDTLKEIQKTAKDDTYVRFDFGYFTPKNLGSYRGFYDELAIGYDDGEYSTLNDFIKMLEEALTKTFCGWKGGDYTMTRSTPLWVANSGEANETAVVNIINDGFRVIIETKYIEG